MKAHAGREVAVETIKVEVKELDRTVSVPVAVYGRCPLCGGYVYDRQADALGCTGCPFTLRKEYYHDPLTEADVVALISTGETRRISGFHSQGSFNAFSAKLILAGGKVRLAEFRDDSPPGEKAIVVRPAP